MFMYHVNSYESKNFSKTEAKISIGLTKLFNIMTFKVWKINVPQKAGILKGVPMSSFGTQTILKTSETTNLGS